MSQLQGQVLDQVFQVSHDLPKDSLGHALAQFDTLPEDSIRAWVEIECSDQSMLPEKAWMTFHHPELPFRAYMTPDLMYYQEEDVQILVSASGRRLKLHYARQTPTLERLLSYSIAWAAQQLAFEQGMCQFPGVCLESDEALWMVAGRELFGLTGFLEHAIAAGARPLEGYPVVMEAGTGGHWFGKFSQVDKPVRYIRLLQWTSLESLVRLGRMQPWLDEVNVVLDYKQRYLLPQEVLQRRAFLERTIGDLECHQVFLGNDVKQHQKVIRKLFEF